MHSEEAGKKDETLELLEEYLGQYKKGEAQTAPPGAEAQGY